MGDSDSSDSDTEGSGDGKEGKKHTKKNTAVNGKHEEADAPDWDATLKGEDVWEKSMAANGNGNGLVNRTKSNRGRSKRVGPKIADIESGLVEDVKDKDGKGEPISKSRRASFQLPMPMSISTLEQSMPADAVLGKQGAEQVRWLLSAFLL